MSKGGILKITAALLALPSLSGCVAAVAAIPVLAGGGVAVGVNNGERGDDAGRLEPTNAPPPPFADDADERAVAAAAVPTIPANASPGVREPITQPDPVPTQPSTPVEAGLAAPAAPTAVAAHASESSASARSGAKLGSNPYDAFYAYAVNQARLDPVDNPRTSAILATPGSLTPIMSDCAILPPAVLIDLDVGNETIDLDQPVSPNEELAEALAALRAQNTSIFWISGASAADAGKLRDRLLVSGLDPWRRDGLLLMRRPDDRKQIRRSELSEMHCVVAIAGDRKGDFDELFDYLKNPAAAEPLDALVGEGWFITPPPFESEED